MARTDNAELVERLEQFLDKFYREDILHLADKYPSEKRSLTIDWMDLYRWDGDVADDTLTHPETMQEYFEAALENYDIPVDISLSDAHVRFTGLNEMDVYDVGEYNQHDVTELIGVKGQVTQLTNPKPKLKTAVWECARCGTLTEVNQTGMDTQQPHECAGCERQGPFNLMVDQSEFVDFQMARVKLPPEKNRGGDAKVDVHLYDDMASSLEGNERVNFTGKLSLDTDDLDSTVFDYQLDTNPGAVEVTEGGYEDVEIDEHLDEIKDIAAKDDPIQFLKENLTDLYLHDELQDPVEAVVLQLVGADRKNPDGGPTFRGDIHVLLLGDPGAGKSKVLDDAEAVSPRAKSASGKGLSKAGATAAAVRNDFGPQEWTLKAGLLVLANDGLACLDEIDKVDPDARSSMHSALARQRVDVVKAGIDATLPARTSLLAAGNPKYGRFDQYEPIGEQIELPPSLMSRFDLMFMISDQPDEDRDRNVASHVAESWDTASRQEAGKASPSEEAERDIPEDVYRAYIAYARERVHPVIEDDDVFNRIVNHYVEVRSKGVDEDNPVPITARKLEAFFRLAEASAKARLSDTVEMQDAERAIDLVMSALRDVGVDPETGQFDADVVETGQSKAQRDRKKAVKAIIMDVEEEHEAGAPLEVVRERAEAIDVNTDKLEHDIDKLKQKGEIYENQTDTFRTS